MATAVEASVDTMPNEPEANKLFRMVMKYKGSDLHLKVGLPPAMRLAGVLRTTQLPVLTMSEMERLMFPLLSPRQREILDTTGGADFAHIIFDPNGDETRFRVNLFKQRGRLSLVARRVNTSIPDFEGLGLPPILSEIVTTDQGIIILAGVTGSGKSTTIASMLQYVNKNERCHIVTIEDPIEFTFKDDKCIINQREVGIDVVDWNTALKHAVRQDPDIILVGEMRDQETFNAAMHAAETGHLVFGTIHASSAPFDDQPNPRPVPGGNALGDAAEPGVQPEGDHRPEAAADDQGVGGLHRPDPRAALRDHADEPDRQEADPQRGRHQARRRRSGWARKRGWSTSPRACGSSSSPRRSSERRPSRSPRTRRPCAWRSRGSRCPNRASCNATAGAARAIGGRLAPAPATSPSRGFQLRAKGITIG